MKILPFLFLPILELYLLIKVGERIGALPVLALLFASASLGAWLVKRHSLLRFDRAMASLAAGDPSTTGLRDGLLLLLAGFLFIFPGFLTDFFGLLLLLPPLRKLLGGFVMDQARKRFNFTGGVYGFRSGSTGATFDCRGFASARPDQPEEGFTVIDCEASEVPTHPENASDPQSRPLRDKKDE